MEIKFVPLTPEIKRGYRVPHKHFELRAQIEKLLAMTGNHEAICIDVPSDKWDYLATAIGSIVYKYNFELKRRALSVRTDKASKQVYVFKNVFTGFDKYLR